MRLVTFAAGDGTCAGILLEDRIHVVAELLGEPDLPDIQALLELPYDSLRRLADAVREGPSGQGRPLGGTTLLSPVLRPPNVRDHVAFEDHASVSHTVDLPAIWYERPLYYYSSTSCMFGPGETVRMPATLQLDYELEIAAIIGRHVSDVDPSDTWAAIAGFAIFNDWSARDIQRAEMAAGLGPSKGKDFASSLGPWIVTLDELAPFIVNDRLDLQCRVIVNGEVWGETRSGTMYHSWPDIVAHASAQGRLLPGDILASGTVAGCCVGDALRRGYDVRYLRDGDRVELEVEGLGTLTNHVSA